MQLDGAAANEIHSVMIGVAAHEDEEVVDPVGDPEAEHLGIELRRLLRIFDDEGDMAEFQWPDAVMLQMLAEVAPFLEQFDGRTLVVLKREHRANAGNGIVAQLAFEAVLFERAGEFAEIRMRRDLE